MTWGDEPADHARIMFATHQRDDGLSRRCSSSLVLSSSGDAAAVVSHQSSSSASSSPLHRSGSLPGLTGVFFLRGHGPFDLRPLTLQGTGLSNADSLNHAGHVIDEVNEQNSQQLFSGPDSTRMMGEFGSERRKPCSPDHEPPTNNLVELMDLLDEQEYHSTKEADLTALDKQFHIALAQSQRLISLSRDVRRLLAECLRSEDKTSFANLRNVFQEGCRAILASSTAISVRPSHSQYQEDGLLDNVSTQSRNSILTLLTRLRYDEAFVATQFANLSHKHLAMLLPDSSSSKSVSSVLENVNTSHKGPSPLGFAIDRLMEDVAGNASSSPLDTIIRLAHGDMFLRKEPTQLATRVWSTVCAQLIQEERTGSEKIVPHMLDVWSNISEWFGKDKLEIWMLETLQNGSFLLERSKSFSQRMQTTSDAASVQSNRKEAFFEEAITKFLTLCTDKSLASIIPSGAILFSHAIAAKLQQQSKYRKGFASYVAARWLFLSYIPNLLLLPEAFGMLHGHFVSEIAKSCIFKEIIQRIQRIGLNIAYGWKHYVAATTQQIDLIRKTIALFELPEGHAAEQTKQVPVIFNFAISVGDVLTTIDSLFPSRPAASIFSDTNTLRSGLHSSASSISGFSLFQNHETSHENLASTGTSTPLVLDTNLSETSMFTDARDDLADLAQATETRSWSVVHVDDAIGEIVMPGDTLASSLAQLDLNDQSPSWWQDSLYFAREDRLTSRKDSKTLASGRSLLTDLASVFERRIALTTAGGDFEAAQNCNDIRKAYDEYVEHSSSKALSELYQATKSSAIAGKTAATRHNVQLESSIRLSERLVKAASNLLLTSLDDLQSLRDKMWYTVSLRRSAAFEDLQGTANALLTMGQTKHSASRSNAIRPMNGSRNGSNFMQRTNAQIVEILSANSAYGGPNKLKNEQCYVVSQWLAHNNIERICTSEERIHKLCMEIKKCVDQSTNASKADNPMLWSDMLFVNEQTNSVQDIRPRQRLTTETPRNLMTSIHSAPWSAPHDLKSPASQTLSHASSSEFHDFRSPTLTSRSSYIWSPAMTETRSNSSATSIGSYPADSRIVQRESKAAKSNTQLEKELAHRITGLIISDLTTQLFKHGSETDLALFSGLGSGLSSQLQRNSKYQKLPNIHQHTAGLDVVKAVARTIERFALTSNPCQKLQLLSTLQRLLPEFMVLQYGHVAKHWSATTNFHALFSDSQLRPKAIFRELQFMAAFLPASHLQKNMFGGAFIHAAGAANILKSQMISTMIETADGIIAFHTSNRGHSRTSSSTAQHQRDSAAFSLPKHTDPSVDFSAYSMADAGELLQITAKEGNPAAQRELATLYLTHPELMDRVIAPFALPRDVFREELESKWRNQDKSRCDPLTMCVAHHWMLLSSRGGDALAKEYLRQREEMERLP